MFRPSTDRPFARCIVGEDQGVAVAAAVVFESSLHPDRLWLHVEVARDHRRQGIGTEMVRLLQAEVPSSGVTALKSRYTAGPVDKGDAAAGFAASIGMQQIQRSRDVVVEPGGLKLPLFDDDGLTLDDAATGSVELTQLVAKYYNATHDWDRAQMTLGMAQKMLLNDATGAKGVVLLRDKPKERGGKILSFAVSYEPSRIEAPADVLLGWEPDLDDADAAEAIRGLLAMIAHQYPVKLEVDDSMVLLSGLLDALIGAGHATVISETHILATA